MKVIIEKDYDLSTIEKLAKTRDDLIFKEVLRYLLSDVFTTAVITLNNHFTEKDSNIIRINNDNRIIVNTKFGQASLECAGQQVVTIIYQNYSNCLWSKLQIPRKYFDEQNFLECLRILHKKADAPSPFQINETLKHKFDSQPAKSKTGKQKKLKPAPLLEQSSSK